MALQDISRRAGPYSWASNRTYTFGFKVFSTSQVEVTVLRGTTETVLTASLYTVTLNADQENQPGGTVVLANGVETADKVAITSAVPYTQEMELTNQGGFYPDILNSNDDRIVAQIQQLKEGLARSIKVGATSSTSAEAYKAELETTVNNAASDAETAAAAAEAAQEAAEAAQDAAEDAADDAADALDDVTTAINGIPGVVSDEVDSRDIPGQVSTAVTNQDIPSQVATAVSGQDIPGQVAAAVTAEDIPGQVSTAVTNAGIPGLVSTAVTNADIPGQVSTAVTNADIPGQVATAVAAEDVAGQVATAVTNADIPGLVEDEVTEQLTDQLRETVETVVGEVLDDDLVDLIGYTPADDSAVVKHSSQSLTDAQKAQARTNIGAQAALTFDSTPTANSTNPVTSGGVKTAVDGKVSKSGDTMTGKLVIERTGNKQHIELNTNNIDLSTSHTSEEVYQLIKRNTADTTNSSGNISQLLASQTGQDFDLLMRVANPRAGNLPSAGDGVNTGNCWAGIGIHYDYAKNNGYAAGSYLTDWDVNDSNKDHLMSTSLATTRRSCIVGNSGTTTSSPWYKVGTYVSTSGSTPSSNCLLYVACTDATRQRGGMLNVHMRLLQNHAFDPDNTKLEWLTTYGNLNPNDFVLVCNNDSNSVTFDLYVRCNFSYCRYAFKVISEKENSFNTSIPQSVVFTLTNNVSNGSLASLPAGTQVVSTVASLGKGSTKSNLPIVLIVAGQSNAVGSTGGTGSAYRSSITLSTGGYWNGETNAWVSGIADPVWPTNSGSFIPSLCKTLTERTGRPVYIINVAVSNTVVASQNTSHTIDQKWSSNGTLRARALQIINSALATIAVPYELLGTVWLQGESDMDGIVDSHETLADYTTCINDTVQWFQSNIGGRFFCVPPGYLYYPSNQTSYDRATDSIRISLFDAVRKVDSLVVGSDFTTYARENGYLRDKYHFTVAGYDILGDQIARGIAGMLNGIRTGKRISFSQPFKFPEHDAALAAAEALEADYQEAQNVWPQGATSFRKNNTNYLVVLSYLQGGRGITTTDGKNTVGIVTVYNRNTQEYLGYYLIPNMRICESIVVKTESGQDYIYVAMQGNVLGKAPVTIGSSYGSTLTATAITVGSGANAHNIPANWFFGYKNGQWMVEGIANRVSGFTSRTLMFYDDSFNQTGQFDIQTYENDVWKSYEGLTATEQKRQWSLPRTQGIALGADGIYFMKGGGTNAADTTYRLTDIGVAHYNFQGDLVRSSVCNHTKFVNRMNGLVGVRYANSHSECEGGWIDDDGTVNHFAIINSTTGRLVVTEEFSTAPDAVDFTDCLANYYSNIPFQTNTPQFPRGNDANYFNPFTGDKLTSIDDVLYMCAFWGLDDITISTLGTDWNMTIGSTDISIPGSYPKNGSLHIKRFTNDRFWVTVYDGVGQEVPTTWLVVTDASTYAVSSCTKQRNVDGNTPVSIVSSGTGWRRFSDGTQECWGCVRNNSTDGVAITFPQEFSEVPCVNITVTNLSSDLSATYQAVASKLSATGFTAKMAYNNAATSNGAYFMYRAIGTWSAS